MKNIKKSIESISSNYKEIMDKYVSHILLLSIRIFIALVLYRSGLTKIANMDSTILLFEYEYALPIISPVLAAYSATFSELTFSALLMIGLFTRAAALPLIAMTLVIQFLVFQNHEHFYWLALLSTIAVYGGGKISLGCLLCKICSKCKKGIK